MNDRPSFWTKLQRKFFPSTYDKMCVTFGHEGSEQLDYLMQMVKTFPAGSKVVEIGVWTGRGSLAMGNACRGTDKKVYAVDPWQHYEEVGKSSVEGLKEKNIESFEDVYQTFLKHRKDFQLEQWVEPVRLTSEQAAKTWTHGPVSMLFIDGNHSEDSVKLDLTMWTPIMGKGGLVCGDDWSWPSVRSAVEAFVSEQPKISLEHPCKNTWAFRT